jgi:hypothetical protein
VTSIDCNKCICAGAGEWACTDLACGEPTPGGECKPGDSKSGACTDCKCDGGKWVCADSGCATPSPVCKLGDVTTIDCNTCKCDNGQWACTKVDCSEPSPPAACKPGDSLDVDCNTCKCGDDGQWACTKIECGSTPVSSCPLPASASCDKAGTFAKDPSTGACCFYDLPCQAPAKWTAFPSQVDCEAGK